MHICERSLTFIMTEKQEKIVQAALQLFAQEGYHATSTSKVAKLANVSEGLIFRHFKNKEGLLTAVLNEGEIKLRDLFADIVLDTDPKAVIRKTITLFNKIDVADYDFWKLQFKLKWELELNADKKMEPIKMALTNAFRKLNYQNPEQEAQLLLLFTEGLSTSVLKGSEINLNELTELLLKKYQL